MRYSFFTILCVALIAFAACNKGASPSYNDRPVVTAYIQADTTPLVKVARQLSTTSAIIASSENLDSLKIYITDSNASVTYQLSHLDSGYYEGKNLVLKAGHTYNLLFHYNGKDVTSSTTIPSKPVGFTQSVSSVSMQKLSAGNTGSFGINRIDPIELNWTNTDNSYYVVVVENIEANPELIRDTLSTGSTRPLRTFRNTPSAATTASINGEQLEYFGVHRIYLYHLNPDYAALYTLSGSSSQDLSTPNTNIVNGFGIFTGLNADTLYLNVLKK